MDKILNKIQNASFNTIGTNGNSYIKKFMEKIENNTGIYELNLEDKWQIFSKNNILLWTFTSVSTKRQFLNSLEAYGFLEPITGSYKVLFNKYSFKDVTNAIFSYSDDEKINVIRQSRMLSLLREINIINDKNFNTLNIVGKQGNTKLHALLKEKTKWEDECLLSIDNLILALERIKKYEFKKK